MQTTESEKHITRMKITGQYLLEYGCKNIRQNTSETNRAIYKEEFYIAAK